MADLPQSLSQDTYVKLAEGCHVNCIIWADDIVLLSETEEGLNKHLSELKLFN